MTVGADWPRSRSPFAGSGVIGVLIGIGGVYLVAAVSPLKASVSFASIAISFGVSGGIGLFFGVIPAQRAARLDPIVALRGM